MIVTELRLLIFILFIFLLTTPTILVDAIAGRCYLCSQNTLAECAGSTQRDSPLYNTVLQYYTEPCNGQCVLFRNENTSTIRGCSWTYGHMTSKSTGWHELSPGIRAYFCDSYLCNNGTYDQPEMTTIRIGSINNEFIPSPQQTHSPQQLFILAGNPLSVAHTGEFHALVRIDFQLIRISLLTPKQRINDDGLFLLLCILISYKKYKFRSTFTSYQQYTPSITSMLFLYSSSKWLW